MKPSTQALRDSLYNFDRHIPADLWTFAFTDGTKRWTSFSEPITSGGTTWTVGPGFKRGEISARTGLETDTLELEVYPDASTVGGLSLFRSAAEGLWDGVKVTLQRAYMQAPPDASAGVVTEFEGYVDEATPGQVEIRLRVQSVLAGFDTPIPKRMTVAQCPYQWGEASTCGVTVATYTHARTVAAGSTVGAVVLSSASTMAVPASRVVFTSGALAGITRMVRSVSGATLTLAVALPSVPVTGAGLSVIRGCDKTLTTCGTVFANKQRFGGFPFVPASRSA